MGQGNSVSPGNKYLLSKNGKKREKDKAEKKQTPAVRQEKTLKAENCAWWSAKVGGRG